MAAAPGANAGKDDDGAVPPRVSMTELVKRWECVCDNLGHEKAMELFMTLLLRDARAESAQQEQARKDEEEEEEERRARIFEPWHPPPPGTALPIPVKAPPRVDRTVVLALRAPPHLRPPRPKHQRTTTPSSAPAADRPDLGRSVKPAKKPLAACSRDLRSVRSLPHNG